MGARPLIYPYDLDDSSVYNAAVTDSDSQDLRPAPGAAAKLDRLKGLLREMFQLDRGDLDFGIYRIMNLKASEIVAFLDHDLLPQVKAKLNLTSVEEMAALEARLEAARESARGLGIDPDTKAPPAIRQLQQRLAEMRKDADAESDVYNHLASFFARYYADGDFVSQRRYASGGRSAYLIPYDGEEVKLYWANADQYYVKTTENYANYAFTVGGAQRARRVRLEISAACTQRDNVKEATGRQRRFLLATGEGAVAADEDELVVRFEHRPLTDGEKRRWPGTGGPQQSRINGATCERILRTVTPDWQLLLAEPTPTEADGERTLLAKHMERYTARNSFDYFIHKDLGGFLRREVDLYVNSEVLNPDDLEQGDASRLDRALARVRAVRHVGGKIIDFLAQLENFQKQLWLKKKFVLETNWCVTLDRVPEQMLPAIASNEAQCEEWVRLFAVDEIEGDLINGGFTWTDPPSVDFLKAHPHLVLDTRHFDRDFAERLLETLSDAGPLDRHTNGLLIHGENFQALNLLQTRYRGQVKCVYIDPPYNTDASAILYKNNYKDSSWLSFIGEGLLLARLCMSEAGVLCAAIDDQEVSLLRLLLRTLLPRELGTVAVRSNPAGRKSRGQFSPAHEYALFFGRAGATPGTLNKTANELARYPLLDDEGYYAWNNLIRHGSGDRRHDRPTMFYPIHVSDTDVIRVPEIVWNADQQAYSVLEEPNAAEVAVWPTVEEDGSIIEKRWHRGPDRIAKPSSDYRVRRTSEGTHRTIDLDFKIRPDLDSMPRTWWDDKRYASANLGAKTIKELFGDKGFDFAKATGLVEDCLRASRCDADSVVLDYFAGSGTTGHAVVNLNRADGGRRTFVLVEVGHHFDTVLLPRLKKIVYSPDWKEGKPVSRHGVSQLVKYIRLESYEDTLESLEVAPLSGAQRALLAGNPELEEDYRLRYALTVETAGSAGLLGRDFIDPWSYTITVVREGIRREVPVDLTETFNFLIGLRVESCRRIDGVLAITGTDAERRRCLILWRNLDRIDHAALDAWFSMRRKRFPGPLHVIYVNGDHTLNALQQAGDTWVAETIEPVFRELMFGGQ